MALSFLKNKMKGTDEVIAVDLGGRSTKAVHMQRKGSSYVLCGYTVLDAPLYEKTIPVDLLTEHPKTINQALGATKSRQVTLAVGVNESVVRLTEMPQMPVGDMRQILRNNSKTYLQQDLSGYVYDCFIFPALANANEKGKVSAASMVPKNRVLAAGMKKQLVDDIQTAIKNAGLLPDQIVPGVIGPVNAFEAAKPEEFAKGVVALVDIGFRNSTISILQEGQLMLNR